MRGFRNADRSEIKEWRNLRDDVFEFLSKEVFGKSTAWAGTHLLDHETMGLHHYSPQRLVSGVCDYNPPHKDSGTLTILVREGNGPDGLEVADLDTTKEVDSARIGLEASFLAVPVAEYEVVVFFGTRSQRLLGKDVARACVHRVCSVRNGYSSAEERFSAAIFCAPPV
jgi:isopenicillin N synthase-like dioxygenase